MRRLSSKLQKSLLVAHNTADEITALGSPEGGTGLVGRVHTLYRLGYRGEITSHHHVQAGWGLGIRLPRSSES
jgi:hypothetical protein